ncbi:hypothetical protein Kfla_1404 [Kribbella flavida DSM 17836]|uniref:Uncharacterized protein n=1 Tax=Kribbella flavida (strain DSM 17836 / JCM 10339 / NBRC 14399) TaxID=479435 RepID=D2PKJ3_KRIFD|nr:hypothetical protein [Kribbella flavida]ADB30505.1 hypothetical protein Kfla_1404 [Kribbella flavida DSM 17836]
MTLDLKQGLATSLADVEPMPDVVPTVLAAGARSVRRRRALAGATAVFSTVALVAGAVTVVPAVRSTMPVVEPGSTLRSIPPVLEYDEFLDHVAETLSVLLPERFGEVQVAPGGGKGNLTVTADGATFPLQVELLEPMADFPSPGTRCVPPTPLDKGTVRVEPGDDGCQVRQVPSGGLAIVRQESGAQQQTVENGVTVLRPVPGAKIWWLVVDHHGLGLRLALFPDEQAGIAAPITSDELLTLAADEHLEALLDAWASHLSATYRWVRTPTTPPTPR